MRPGIPLIFAVCLVMVSSFACSSGGGRGASTGGSGAEAIARRAMAALVSGDAQGYLNEVRPDYLAGERESGAQQHISELSGCSLDGAQFLTQQADVSTYMTFVVFAHPCGTAGEVLNGNFVPMGGPLARCELDVANLSGRWYLSIAACFEH